MKELFDEQIEKLKLLIEASLVEYQIRDGRPIVSTADSLADRDTRLGVDGTLTQRQDSIFLSGGFGTSKYLQKKLREHLKNLERFPHSSRLLQTVSLHIASRPQMCVCIGLLHQKLRDNELYTNFHAASSIGILCHVNKSADRRTWDTIVNEAKVHMKLVIDSSNQQLIRDWVQWIVKKVRQPKATPLFPTNPSDRWPETFADPMELQSDPISLGYSKRVHLVEVFDARAPVESRRKHLEIVRSSSRQPLQFLLNHDG